MTTEQKFNLWCIIELFGHQKIAGLCTEQNIAGTNMLRVDVPATTKQPEFTRFFGSAAIYAINPVDEITAKHFAEQLEVKPIQSWDVKEMLVKNSQLMVAAKVQGLQNNSEGELSDVAGDDLHDDNDGYPMTKDY